MVESAWRAVRHSPALRANYERVMHGQRQREDNDKSAALHAVSSSISRVSVSDSFVFPANQSACLRCSICRVGLVSIRSTGLASEELCDALPAPDRIILSWNEQNAVLRLYDCKDLAVS